MNRTVLGALVLIGAALAGCDGGSDRLVVYLRHSGESLLSDEVVVAGVDGETIRTIDLPIEAERLIPTGYGDTLFALGPDEELLFVDAGEGKAEKLELPDGMGIQSLFFNPSVSADSLQYRLLASPLAASVAVLDQSTGEVEVVAEDTRGVFAGARLSDDAEHVAVLTADELRVTSIDAPDEAMTFEGPIGSPSFGDGRITFVRNPGRPDAEIVIVTLEGSDETTIPVAEHGVFWVAFVPGEDRLAMLGEDGDGTKILSADADGGSVEQVGSYDGSASPPVLFSPEGGGLTFRDEGEDTWVWAGLDGDEPRPLTDLPPNMQPSGHLARWVSFTSQTGGGDVSVLDLETGETDNVLDTDSSISLVQGFPGAGTADGMLALALTSSEDGTDFWLLRLADFSADKLVSGDDLRGAALSADGEVFAFGRTGSGEAPRFSIEVREVGGDRLATIEDAIFPVIVGP